MTDAPEARPRPQYGEYATAEEQAARIRTPAVVAQPVPVVEAAAAPQRRPRVVDLAVTVGLLGYGFVNLLTQIPQFLDPTAFTSQLLTMMDVEATLSDPAGARTWGLAALIVMSVGWLATAALCTVRLRAGRSAWWIALVAGVVVQLICASLLLVPIYSDPVVRQALLGVGL